MYKMLVLDLDDTLLNSQREISAVDKAALMKAQAQGIKVVLASGRPTCGMLPFAKELESAQYNSYIISFNGGEIVRCSDQKVLFEKSLTKEELHRFYHFSREQNADMITYRGDAIITQDASDYIEVERELLKVPVETVDSFCDEVDYSAVKCILLQEPSYLKQVEANMKAQFPQMSISISKPFFLEVTAPNIDKGQTLAKLCEMEGIHANEVIAVGNAGNDLSMIEYAGLGVWVANTDEALKPLGDAVTASCDEGGVAQVVEQYLLAAQEQEEQQQTEWFEPACSFAG